jgi:type II secretory pathway component PulK
MITASTYIHGRWKEDGLALITVIAVIAILSIIVLEFASRTLTDLDISANFRDRTQAQYNAEAGFNFAMKVLRDDDTSNDTLQDTWAAPQEIFIGDLVKHYRVPEEGDKAKSEREIAEEVAEIPEPVDQGFGKAYICIVDEERKLNINRLVPSQGVPDAEFRQVLTRLLRTLEYPDFDVDGFLDNVVDWIDADDDGPTEKSSYYDYLDQPYEPSNAALSSIYQLLLVKEMNPRILFGDTPFPLQKSGAEEENESIDYSNAETEPVNPDKKPIYGLNNFINTCTRSAININTAPREVLLALFDDQQFLVDDIITKRIESPLISNEVITSIFSSVSPDYYTTKRRYIQIRSNYFWVVSIGEYGNARVKLVGLLYRVSQNEIRVIYQRYENMSRDEEIPYAKKTVAPQEGS